MNVCVYCVSVVLRRRWVGTLQEHVRDQLVFGRRRFGPGSHCQKHGVLELKGTKSKVYAAINTEQIWLYKSEQVIIRTTNQLTRVKQSLMNCSCSNLKTLNIKTYQLHL